MKTLELIGATNDVVIAKTTAARLGGRVLVDERAKPGLPFRALVCAVTDDFEAVSDAAEIGVYLGCRRSMRARPQGETHRVQDGDLVSLPGVIGLFTMVRHPELSHRQADDHWRDRHTPLALVHHPLMTHYSQLSVVRRLRGPRWDGFALCGFDSKEDLVQRFYGSEQSKRLIREDVARFADPSASPMPLIATEWSGEGD